MIKYFQCSRSGDILTQKPLKSHAEMVPAILRHHIFPVCRTFEAPDKSVLETEVL